jgi:hypothetical protein
VPFDEQLTRKRMPRPTKRAPDGWWAPRFELDSSEESGSVSLVGSLQPPVTQAVGQFEEVSCQEGNIE